MSRAPMSLDEPSRVSRPAALVGVIVGVLYLAVAIIITSAPGDPAVESSAVVLAHSLALGILGGVTSFLIYAHAIRTGNAGYLALAGTFASAVVLAVALPPAFPGGLVSDDDGTPIRLIGGLQTPISLFYAWHLVLYIGLPVSCLLIERGSGQRRHQLSTPRIALSLLLWLGLSMLFVLISYLAPGALPTLIGEAGITSLAVALDWLLVLTALAGGVIVIAATHLNSAISRWILAVIVISIGEAIVNVGVERYSIGWYFNRTFGLAAMTALLLSLVWEIARVDQATLSVASYDALTKTMSRATFERELSRRGGTDGPAGAMAMLWIDLDDFKSINDRLGHHVGDEVLRVAAQRMQRQVRAQDLVARMGGDEFAVAVMGAESVEAAETAAQRITSEVAKPMDVSGHRVYTSCSIGLALAPTDAVAPLELAHKADIAMYDAKAAGGNRLVRYRPGLDEHARSLADLRTQLQEGIDHGQFIPYGQPIIDVQTRTMVGLEILTRWAHPAGLRTMGEIIEVAESSRLIGPIGDQVRRGVLQHLGSLLTGPTALDFITVNLSVRELSDGPSVTQLLSPEWRPYAPRLVLEITESVVLHESDRAKAALAELRAAGYRIAVDDFGVGFSTIARLQQLGATFVKSDRSLLLRQSESSADPADVIRVVYDIARVLRGQLIVEGVETVEEDALARSMGNVLGQGYRYGRPEALENWALRIGKGTAV